MSDLIQVLEDTPAQPRGKFYSAGVPTDLDSAAVPTVALKKPDGTAGPASGTVTRVSTGVYTFTLQATSTADPIVYDAAWTGNIGGLATTVKTKVEVVGALLFTIADLRAVKVAGATPFNATDYPDEVVAARRVQVTGDFERRAGWSFIPRYAREVFDGAGQASLVLSKFLCQRLLSVTIDGVAQTVGDYVLADTGLLQRKAGGTFSDLAPQNVAVEYVHGFTTPPEEVTDAALARAASLLLPSLVSSTVSTWTTPDGTTYSYDQAGQTFGGSRRYYGIPKIDSVLADPAYNARRGGVFA